MNIWFTITMLGFFALLAYFLKIVANHRLETEKLFHEEELERIRLGKE